ncbi:MAG: heavy metal sensor histidine kinase [Candidatus Omnitrophica bacterium]|nr:heavy metal sensor histidine kinase [Candidatus Omnitrophota bacterium]
MFSKKSLVKGIWFKSIGWKLTLWYASLFMLSILLISFFLYQRLEFQLHQEVDLFLADEMNEFRQFVIEHQDNLPLIERQMQRESAAIRKHYQMYYGILDAKGKTILQSSEFHLPVSKSRSVDSSILVDSDVKEYEINDEKDTYVVRIATRSIQSQNDFICYLQMGMNLARIEKTLSNYCKNILLISPMFFILSLAGGLFLARRNLKPISHIIQTVSRITVSNLKERLPMRGTGDELDGLAQTFNQMIERLDQAYQKLSQFSVDVAHELRTPVTSLIGEIEVALSRESLPKEYRTVLSSNLEELTRLMSLVNNLLFLSKNENPEQVKDRKTIELNEIAHDIAELFKPVAEETNVTLSTDILPIPIYISGDKWRIEQLISNLLDNAIRYNRPGGSVIVSLNQNERYAELIVRDTGVGISEEEQAKIFDRFYRADPSRSWNSGGFGLGLNIVKSAVEDYSGTISVDSQLGKGSTFTIKLPLQSHFRSSILKP